jgi:hypothetical protein
LTGDGGGRIDDRYVGSHDAADGGHEVGIVGSAEDELIDARVE